MANFFTKKAKLIFFIYTIVLASVFILGCGFMTNYKDIMVNYSINPTSGKIEISSDTEGVVGTGKNSNLFQKFATYVFDEDKYVEMDLIRLNNLITKLDDNGKEVKGTKYAKIEDAEKARDTAYFTTIPKLQKDLAQYVDCDVKSVETEFAYFVNSNAEKNDDTLVKDTETLYGYEFEFYTQKRSRDEYEFKTNEDGSFKTNAAYQALIDEKNELQLKLDSIISDEDQAKIDKKTKVWTDSRNYQQYLKSALDKSKADFQTLYPEYVAYKNSSNPNATKLEDYENQIDELKEQILIYNILYSGRAISVNENGNLVEDKSKYIKIDADNDGEFNEYEVDLDGDGENGEVSNVFYDKNGVLTEVIIPTAELVYNKDTNEIEYLRITSTNFESELYGSGSNYKVDGENMFRNFVTRYLNVRNTDENYIKVKETYDALKDVEMDITNANILMQNYNKNYTAALNTYDTSVAQIDKLFSEIAFIKDDIKRVEDFEFPADFKFISDYLLDENGGYVLDDNGNKILSFEKSAFKVYEYRESLNEFNDLIFTFGLVSMIALAMLYVFANHSRRIYYKSNLFAGLILPLVPAIFGIIMIVNVLDLMGTFNDNYYLFNFVSVMQNNVTSGAAYDWSLPTIIDNFTCSDFTFILTMIIYIIIVVCSVFMMVYTLIRYKSCAKERTEIIDRAVANND